jgi:hypothetical protein
LLATILGHFCLSGQNTATNFNANDCAGNNHELFEELNAGNVIVLCWVMPCSACSSPAVSAYNIVQSYSLSNPGKIKFYLCDDFANTSCATLSNWAAGNGIGYDALFSNSSIKMSHYGTNGMPKTVVLGGGTSHQVYFNQNNSLNASNFTNAINNAIAGSNLTYTLSPARTVSFTAALNDLTVEDIFQVNTGNSKIILKWEKISVDLPAEWQYSMCDLGTCHPGIPNGPTTMDTVAVAAKGFLGLNIDPGTKAGSGMVKAYVWQDGFKAYGDTLTWYVSTPEGVGIGENPFESQIRFYPNPAVDVLNISLGENKAKSCIISDIWGRSVLEFEPINGNNQIDVSGLKRGYYIITIETTEKKFFKRITIE